MQIEMLILGGIISIISSLMTYFCQQIFSDIKASKGEVKIYARFQKYYIRFYPTIIGKSFAVPLTIEIYNTKSINQIIRNMNVGLYNKGQFIRNANQVLSRETSSKVKIFGNEGSYSFLVQANEIKTYTLLFEGSEESLEGAEFDEIRLSYFDSKDERKESSLFKFDEAWNKSYESDGQWIRLF